MAETGATERHLPLLPVLRSSVANIEFNLNIALHLDFAAMHIKFEHSNVLW
jgi:hypothetical protein